MFDEACRICDDMPMKNPILRLCACFSLVCLVSLLTACDGASSSGAGSTSVSGSFGGTTTSSSGGGSIAVTVKQKETE